MAIDKANRSHSMLSMLIAMSLILTLKPAIAQQQEWVYIVTEEDTLWDLSKKYFPSISYWKKFKQLNGISAPETIRPGMRLRVPMAWLTKKPVAAKLIATTGEVTLVAAKSHEPINAQAGATIQLGDELQTAAGASAAIEFADGSIVTVRQHTTMVFDHLTAYSDTGMVDTRLRVKSGRVEVRAKPAVGPGSRFEIRTPAAVSAVRGTGYRASTLDQGRASAVEVLEGEVATTGGTQTIIIPAEFGTRIALGEAPLPPRALLKAPLLAPLPKRIEQQHWPLTWEPIAGAESYRVEVAASADFSTVLWEQGIAKPPVALPELDDGDYVLRIRAVDPLGLEGLDHYQALVIHTQPQAPVPEQPVGGAIIRDEMPRLRWAEVAGAGTYCLQLATDKAFATPLIDQCQLSQPHFMAPILPPGHYYWRLASVDANNKQGPFSTAAGFQIKPAAAAPVVLVTADQAETRASWPGASPGQWYRVEIARDAEFTQLLQQETTANTWIEVSPRSSGERYLRVRSIEEDGYEGPWSTTQRIEPVTDYSWIFAVSIGLLLLVLL